MIDLKALMTQEGYAKALRGPVRGLWAGALSFDNFFDMMMTTVRAGFTAAWHKGMEEAGLKPDEMSSAEKMALQVAISTEFGFIEGFGDAIEKNSKANDGKLESLLSRTELWVKRYRDVQNRALQMAQNDPKLKWVMDPAKENCRSCQRLNGQVRRASTWKKWDVRPQHPTKLECMISAGGPSVCGCSFEVTDQRCTPGRLPGLP